INVPKGTPITLAIVKPANIDAIITGCFGLGIVSLVIDIHNAVNTPLTIADKTLEINNIKYEPANAIIIFTNIKTTIRLNITLCFLNLLTKAVNIGVPPAKAIANPESSVPDFDIVIFNSVDISVNKPIITNSLVPITKVKRTKVKINNFCKFVNVLS